jgi:choline-sulfatase
MYEESAGIPMIFAGPDVPRGNTCPTPVSLVDGFPTFMQALGAAANPRDRDLPGHSLIDIADGYVPKRTILSEYHAAGAATGSFMIRHRQYKYIHYVGMPPMLFDLEADPDERTDLGRDPKLTDVVRECEARLRAIVNPEHVDQLARADQQQMIEKHGGKEAIMKRGHFRYSPPPGAKPAFY